MEFLDLEGKEDRQIIFDVFDLNGLQRDIFDQLEDAQLTVQEIADRVDRNRSTVQRALQEMLEKDLVMREGKTDKTVYYVYTTLPIDELRQLTLDALDTWKNEVEQRLAQ
ncbi:MAG: helix-turn-helix domain-containing protein [Candidatus Nanohaloarchaea archaeon]